MEEYTVEVRCQALRRTWGLVDHYFVVIGDREYHPGEGTIRPAGATAGAHTVVVKTVCRACYEKILTNYDLREDRRLFEYYPLVNCETLSTGLSVQSLSFLAVPFVMTLALTGRPLWSLVLALFSLVFFLWYSKYVFSRTKRQTCRHIQQQ